MTSTQVVETSVTVNDNSPFQDYPHPDNHTTRSTVTPGFKPFTVKQLDIKVILANVAFKFMKRYRKEWALSSHIFCLHSIRLQKQPVIL